MFCANSYYILLFFRQSVILSLKTELRRQGPGGELAMTMSVIKKSPEAYLEYMNVRGRFADQIFIAMLASLLQHDIIVLPVHPRAGSVENNYIRHPGGVFGSQESAPSQPIFLAYYEEHQFSAGHYQAVEPRTNGPVLQDILQKGGMDVAAELSLPDHVGRFDIINKSIWILAS